MSDQHVSTFVTRVLSMFTQHNSVKQQMSASIKRSHSPCHNHSDTVFGPTSNTPWLLASTAESPILFPLVLQQADLLPAVPEQPGGYKEGQALLGENLEYFSETFGTSPLPGQEVIFLLYIEVSCSAKKQP